MFGDDPEKIPDAVETEQDLDSEQKSELETAYESNYETIHFFAQGVCSDDGSNFPATETDGDYEWVPDPDKLDIPDYSCKKMLAAICIGQVAAMMEDTVQKAINDVSENVTIRHHCYTYIGKLAMQNGHDN